MFSRRFWLTGLSFFAWRFGWRGAFFGGTIAIVPYSSAADYYHIPYSGVVDYYHTLCRGDRPGRPNIMAQWFVTTPSVGADGNLPAVFLRYSLYSKPKDAMHSLTAS